MTMRKNKKPIVGHRKIVKQGGTYYISLPPGWMESSDIDPKKIKKLLTIANADIRIVNPVNEGKIYDEIERLVKSGEYKRAEEDK